MINASKQGQNGERKGAVRITRSTVIPYSVSVRRPYGSPMLKNVLIALAFLIVAVFAFIGYNSYSARQHDTSDEVFSGDSPLPPATTARPAASSSQVPATAPTAAAATAGTEVTAGGARSTNGVAPPAADSIAPDPPNGMTFGGAGHYQLYRQGDLTWRLNTDTGETCVLFATDEEWRKPKVYKSGCRNHA